MIIAIDGPSSSGKGTIAQLLGAKLGFSVLDTGLLYRLLGYMVLKNGKDPSNKKAVLEALKHFKYDSLALNSPVLRDDSVAKAASIVSAFPEVRDALLSYQREFAKAPPGMTKGAILDGRDIGTVVLPDADLKVFITASVKVRAHRRWKELQHRDVMCMFDDVLRDLKDRDDRDTHRECSPLKPSADAYIIDTSDLTPQMAVDKILTLIKS